MVVFSSTGECVFAKKNFNSNSFPHSFTQNNHFLILSPENTQHFKMDIGYMQEWFMDVMDSNTESIIRDLMRWYNDTSPADRDVVGLAVCDMLFKLAIRHPYKQVHMPIYMALRTLGKEPCVKQHELFRELFYHLVVEKRLV